MILFFLSFIILFICLSVCLFIYKGSQGVKAGLELAV